MSKYKYVLNFSNGDKLDSLEEYGDYSPDEAIFDSYKEAEEAALYASGCSKIGTEILHMSNPGDYDYDDETWENPEYEIEEVDE